MHKDYKPVETIDFKRASDLVEILDDCLNKEETKRPTIN
jgi:hypothetical protein